MRRRKFLTTTAAGTVALASADSLWAFAQEKSSYRDDIGLQLYTLRKQLADDTPGTIKAVAQAGYKQVEPFGFPDCQAMIDAAKDNGLAVRSSHFAWDSVVNPDDKDIPAFTEILDKAKSNGLTHLVIPYLADRNRTGPDEYKRIAENCNRAAEQAKRAGIQLAYHNHSFEFKPLDNGRTAYDLLVDEFSADMKFEVDVFWVQVGGVDPVKLMKKLDGRVSQVHLKDLKDGLDLPEYASVPEDAFQELGDGVIPMTPILKIARKIGVAHCHVEQDHSPDPVASILQSMEHLRTL